ncbi:acyltransferase family protein [Massilia sp. DWR3-1-1]|uniref:acyltransferase family protein n=1 Tax=Massilia sp. DWR3-1-1 TaxID=2804559 RepID=UPI003CFAB53D
MPASAHPSFSNSHWNVSPMHRQATVSPAPSHLTYRADIDGLRAIAVGFVVLFHAFPAAIKGGFVGVDIFFVISGFLISKILIGGLQRGSFAFRDFYARRIRRIFPALIVVMGSSLAFGYVAMFPDEFMLLAKHVMGGAGFIANLMLWYEVGYFDVAAETKPLLHLWSLGIEEQFYLVWPILLALVFRFKSGVVQLILLCLLVSLLVNVAGVHRFPSATFYSIASRAWELLFGALLACLSLRQFALRFGHWQYASADHGATVSGALFDSASASGRALMSAAGLLCIVIACAVVRSDQAFPGWWALLPVLGAALLIAAGPTAWVNRHILGNRVMVWLGMISYPLYLWHWPLLSFARIIESGMPSWQIRLGAVVAAVLLAWLTYRLVELPLRRRGRKGATILLVSLMLVVAGVAGLIYRAQGLPERASVVATAAQQKALLTVEDRASATACKLRYGFATLWEYCLLAKPDAAPTVAMVGDSHAYHLSAGFTKYYTAQGENLWFLGTRIPFWGGADGPGSDKYQQATRQMLDLALNTPTVHKVILSTIQKFSADTPDGTLLIAQFRETLRRYVAAGKHVIYIYDVPNLDFEPRSCIKRGAIPSSTTRTDCSMARATFDDATRAHNAIVQSVLKQFPTVEVFSTAPYLCDASRCHGMIDGKLMYRDVNHLTYDGDLLLGSKFAAEQAARAARRP